MDNEQNGLNAIPRIERTIFSENDDLQYQLNGNVPNHGLSDHEYSNEDALTCEGESTIDSSVEEQPTVDSHGVLNDAEEAGEQSTEETYISRDHLIQTFQRAVAEFSAAKPDFTDAFNYLSAKRDQQLQAYSKVDPNFADAGQRAKQMQNDVYELIKAARQAKKNPAELIYQIAETYGYGKQDFYRQLSQVQSASRSLTATPGYRAGQPMTIDYLAEMPQADFDRWYWKNKDEFRRIMGG